jgi:hypothetical protein
VSAYSIEPEPPDRASQLSSRAAETVTDVLKSTRNDPTAVPASRLAHVVIEEMNDSE